MQNYRVIKYPYTDDNSIMIKSSASQTYLEKNMGKVLSIKDKALLGLDFNNRDVVSVYNEDDRWLFNAVVE